jgi:hypothetical protein
MAQQTWAYKGGSFLGTDSNLFKGTCLVVEEMGPFREREGGGEKGHGGLEEHSFALPFRATLPINTQHFFFSFLIIIITRVSMYITNKTYLRHRSLHYRMSFMVYIVSYFKGFFLLRLEGSRDSQPDGLITRAKRNGD